MEIANTEDVPSDPGDSSSANMQEIEWSKNYRLANNIDFSELSAADQNRTKSIGSKTYMFQGEFDGNGFEIRGLTLSNSDSGLFAFAAQKLYPRCDDRVPQRLFFPHGGCARASITTA